ncbi:MAG: peptidoglycan -binding protein [Magnetospirillum sp. WYHS-4]
MAGSISRSRLRAGADIWPGFVDALANLLLVVIFLLTLFVVAQFLLTEALSGRDEALKRLQGQVGELADLLALERKANQDLSGNLAMLSEELQATVRARDEFKLAVDATEQERSEAAALIQEVAALKALKEDLERQVAGERNVSAEAAAQVALLNRQIAALHQQMAALTATLAESEAKAKEQNVQIEALGQRLNAALAGKVQELVKYRSEFFGRLREALGSHSDFQVVGDRFVFQSEVLFDTASADLGEAGKRQLDRLAKALKDVSARIPADLQWILRVDGHTDRVPIATPRFPSNWELSAGRAISVVRYLNGQGIPSERMVAAGFGEFQPFDSGKDEAAMRRNRRIEFKLTDR